MTEILIITFSQKRHSFCTLKKTKNLLAPQYPDFLCPLLNRDIVKADSH